jgi:O-antigen/teichoic acid export membrane protein
MTISIINVARQSLKFSVIQIIGTVITMAVSIYVGRILTPEEYGVYGFLGLWLSYAALISPGIINAGSREMPGLLGKGEVAKAVRIQNVALTSELIWALIPFAVIFVASFFFQDSVTRTGMMIIAFSYLTLRITNMFSSMNYIREKFNTVAIGNLILALGVPIIIVISVYWLKVYALLIAPLSVNIILLFYYLKKGPIGYRFQTDRGEIGRLLKIGIVLQAGSLIYWAYQLMDRTLIASFLSQEQLGLYTYAIGFVTVALNLPISFTNVLQPILWRTAHGADSIKEGFKDAKRIAVYLALGTTMLIPLAQLGFYDVVNWITPKYIGSIPVLHVLSYNICLAALVVIPNLVLNSAIVNKQKVVLLFYAVGLVINVALNILIIKLGYGIVGVAWVMIGSQALVTLAMYCYAQRYMFADTKEYLHLQVKILLPFVVSIGFFFLHQYLETSYGIKAFTGISIAAQIVVWGVLIRIFYRDYLSAKEIKALIARAKEGMRARKTAD